MALDYSMSEQVENLSEAQTASPAKAREFFDKNYVTKGMETLLSQGLRRLGGKSDQAVFELKQAMSRGKNDRPRLTRPRGPGVSFSQRQASHHRGAFGFGGCI